MDKKEFKALLADLEKEYGKGTIINLDSKEINLEIESISTGSLLLDRAIGIGGFPKGRIIEIFGPEGSGKTTLALHALAEVQRQKGNVAFIDVEHSININYAEQIGVDLKSLIISQPDSGEQAMEIVSHLVNSNKIDLIIIDSVAALTPLAELRGQMDDNTVGAQARLMSKSLRKLSGAISKSGTIVIFINQIREKIGVIFGNPEVTPGGRALKFFSSLRLDIRVKERIKDGEEFIGQRVRVKCVKNKLAPPYKEADLIFYYKSGIDKKRELFDLAVSSNLIIKNGSWYSFEDKKIGQGVKEAIKILDDIKIYTKLLNLIDSK